MCSRFFDRLRLGNRHEHEAGKRLVVLADHDLVVRLVEDRPVEHAAPRSARARPGRARRRRRSTSGCSSRDDARLSAVDFTPREIDAERARALRARGLLGRPDPRAACSPTVCATAPAQPFTVRSDRRPYRGTLGDVDALARRVAAGMRARGVQPGDAIAFQLPNWLEAAATFYAVAYLGAVVVPIVHFYGPKEVAYILRAHAGEGVGDRRPVRRAGLPRQPRHDARRPARSRVGRGRRRRAGPGNIRVRRAARRRIARRRWRRSTRARPRSSRTRRAPRAIRRASCTRTARSAPRSASSAASSRSRAESTASRPRCRLRRRRSPARRSATASGCSRRCSCRCTAGGRSTSSTCGIRAACCRRCSKTAARPARARRSSSRACSTIPTSIPRATSPLMPVIGLGGSAVPAAVGERAERLGIIDHAQLRQHRAPVDHRLLGRVAARQAAEHRRRAAARRRDAPRRRRRQRRRARRAGRDLEPRARLLRRLHRSRRDRGRVLAPTAGS